MHQTSAGRGAAGGRSGRRRRGLLACAVAVASVVGLLSPAYAADPPTITTSFPKVADVGVSVTVRGTGFSTTATQNTVTVNGVPVTLTQSRVDQLKFTVPADVSSGPLRVQTSAGTVEWIDDVFVPPAPLTAAQVSTSRRAVPGAGSVVARVTDPEQVSLITVPAAAGQQVALHLTGGTFGAAADTASLTVRGPDGAVVSGPTSFGDAGLWVDPVTVPTTGTYTAVVDPAGTAVGKVDIAALVVPADAQVTAQPGGPAVTAAVTSPGQDAAVTFTGTVGQRVSFTFSGNTFSAPFTTVQVRLVGPSGQDVLTPRGLRPDLFLDTRTLTEAGTYRLMVDPVTTGTGQVDVQVHDVPTDTSVAGALDATTELQPTTVPGQSATTTFTGALGQRVAVRVTGAALIGGPGTGVLRLVRPNGATVAEAAVTDGVAFLDPVTLPGIGTYTVVLDPDGRGTGGAAVTPLVVPAEAHIGAVDDGAEHQVPVSIPGARLTVDVTSHPGDRVAIHLTQSTYPDGTPITVTAGDGPVTHPLTASGDLFIEPLTVPASGTITVLFDPVADATGTATLRAIPVEDDLQEQVAVGDGLYLQIGTGQNAALDLLTDITTGDRLHASISWYSYEWPDLPLVVTPVSPDDHLGTPITVPAGGDPVVLDLLREQPGTYRLLVDPAAQATGEAHVQLWDGQAEHAIAVIDGDRVTVSSAPGRPASVEFTVPAADPSARAASIDRQERRAASSTGGPPRLAVRIHDATYNDGGATATRTRASASAALTSPTEATVELTGPDGLPLVAPAVLEATHFVEPFEADAPGTYTVAINPTATRGGSASVEVYTVPDDVTGALTLDGATIDLETNTPGQNVTLTTDNLPSGEGVTLRLRDDRASSRVTITDELGQVIVSGIGLSDTGTLPFTTASGIHTISIDPQGPVVGAWKAELYSHVGTPDFGYGTGGEDWTSNSPYVSWSVAEADAQWAVLVDTTPDSDPGAVPTTDSSGFDEPLPDGEHWLHVRAVLADGNYGRVAHYQFRIDTTAPAVLDLTSPTHPDPDIAVADGTVQLTWTGDDPHSGIAGYSVTMSAAGELTLPDDEIDTTDTTWTQDLPSDGPWTFAVRAVDNANLWSETATHDIAIDATGPGLPVVTSTTHPVGGSSAATLVADFAAADDNDDVVGWRSTLDQQPATDPTEPSVPDANVRHAVTPGTWWLHVQSGDSTGRWSPTQHHQIIVNAATVALTAPVAGQVLWTSDPISFTCAAGADYTVALTGPVTKNLGPVTGDVSGTCSMVWNPAALMVDETRAYPDGTYQLRVVDAVGQPVSDAVAVRVHADADPGEAIGYDAAAGLITQQQAAQLAADTIFNPGALPPRYAGGVSDGVDDRVHDAGQRVIENWQLVDAQTRDQVETLMGYAVGLHSDTEARRGAAAAAAGTCAKRDVGGTKFLGATVFDSYSFSGHFVALYDEDNIGPTDLATGCPQYVVNQLDALEAAYDEYTALGWTLPSIVPVFYRWDIRGGLTLPFGIQIGYDGDTGSRYLPQHELMHTAQFQHYTLGDYARLKGDLWWWNEAVANWGQSHANRRPIPGGYPGVSTYARELNDFLANINGRFDDMDVVRDTLTTGNVLAGGQEYGAFVVPLYLDEQLGPDVVLDVTRRSGRGERASAPSLAMYDELGLRGEQPTELIERLRWSSYALDSGRGGGLGFNTSDVDAYWRDLLVNQNDPTLDQARTPFEPVQMTSDGTVMRGSAAPSPSGSQFVELNRPEHVNGSLRISLDLPEGVVASIARGQITSSGSNHYVNLCYEMGPADHLAPARRIASASYTAELTDACPTAFLHLHSTRRTDEQATGAARWEAKFIAEAVTLDNGTVEMAVNKYGGILSDDLGLRRAGYEVLDKGIPSEGWGIGNTSGLDARYTPDRGVSGSLTLMDFTTSGTEATTVSEVGPTSAFNACASPIRSDPART